MSKLDKKVVLFGGGMSLQYGPFNDTETDLSACHAHSMDMPIHDQGASGDSWSNANAQALQYVQKSLPIAPVSKLAIINGKLVKVDQFETRNQRRLARKKRKK